MSQIEVDKVIPQSGTALQVGESGDTITIPSGATITNNGTATGFDTDTNDKVKVSANDTTAGFLNGKLVAGTNISLTEGSDGGNETLTAALSGTIATSQIANDAITLDKMATGTDGNIISYDASGNPVAVATGSAGQVLTSAGAGAPPTFSTAASSDFVKITTSTISSSVASVSLDGHFSSTYKNYQIVGTGLIFSDSYFAGTTGQGLKARVRQSNADKTDGQYIWTINRSIAYFNGNLNDGNDGAYNSDHFKIIGRNNSGNQFTGNFYMNVYDPLGTSYRKAINWQTSSIETVDNNAGNLGFFSENGSTVYRGNTTALSGFTFFPASGNLTGGTITIYGLKQ